MWEVLSSLILWSKTQKGLVQGHQITRTKPQNQNLLTSHLKLLSPQQSHGTVTWVISSKLGLIPGTTQLSVQIYQVPMSLRVLWPCSDSTHLTRLCCPTQGHDTGFLNARWMGRALKKKCELPHARRKVTHSIEKKRLRGSLTRPQEDRYLGQFTRPQSSPSLLGLINSYCQSHRFDWTQSTDSL